MSATDSYLEREAPSLSDTTALEMLSSASTLSSTTLDLSRRNITLLPEEDFPFCPQLECLYLESNKLSCLSSSLSLQCPSLTWLDLRNNELRSLTPTISRLKCLRTLLLEGNKLVQLPCQLGDLKYLYGLSLTGNPLERPPEYIVKKGTKVVLQYLRDLANSNEDSNGGSLEDSAVSSDEDILGPLPQLLMVKKQSDKESKNSSSLNFIARSAVLQTREKPQRTLDPLSSRNNKRLLSFERKDKEKIDKELAKETSRETLESWRKDTKRLQEVNNTNGSNGKERSVQPPYAVIPSEISSLSLGPSDKDIPPKDEKHDITEWTRDYAKRLRETREHGTSANQNPVSSNLLQAELKLAEALAMRKHFETQRTKQVYRLRAFTGDAA